MKRSFPTLLILMLFAHVACARPGEQYLVSNAREFVEAIGPQRTIVVQPGDYDLSSVADLSGEYYTFLDAFDGMELEISGVTDLHIQGADNFASHLLTRPRYGHVIRFRACQNIRLSNIQAGHGPESGYCTGGVFYFEGCQGVRIDGCLLYGSGTEGLTFVRSQGVRVDKSIIKSCTYSIMSMTDSQDLSFTNCTFFDNREFDLVNVSGCADILFKKCAFNRNDTGYKFFSVQGTEGMTLKKCSFEENKASSFAEGEDVFTQKGLRFHLNQWVSGKYAD